MSDGSAEEAFGEWLPIIETVKDRIFPMDGSSDPIALIVAGDRFTPFLEEFARFVLELSEDGHSDAYWAASLVRAAAERRLEHAHQIMEGE